MAQIRYCLAEDIRIEGAKAALNNYSDSDVDRFNAMVADYNSRCSSFKYQTNNRGRNDLNSAQRDIEPYRSQLQAEGRSRFTRSPSTGSLSAPAQARPAADETVRAVQQKLNELGYSAGLADGLMGRGTRAAIIAFQQDRGLAATGAADQALLLQLQQAPSRSSRPQPDSRPATTSVQLSAAESASLEAACSTDKYVNGPAAYRACVERQKAALAAGVRRPNLSALSSAEQQSIEAACSTDKYVNGPAAYNECLANQLAAMSGQGARRPDLSRLSSSERQSIEAACSTDKYVNGPAAYNRCLNNQLVALERQGGRPDLSRLSTTERNSIEAACSTDKYVNGPAAYNRCLSQQLARLRN
jgi:peptidoglycan hydrolase-like protein with peptidoglycan-binding domain